MKKHSVSIWEGCYKWFDNLRFCKKANENIYVLISFRYDLSIFRYLQIEFPFWYKKKMHVRTIWVLNCIAALLIIFYSHSTLIFSWYRPKENRNNICEYFNILPALYLQIFYIITFSGFPFQSKFLPGVLPGVVLSPPSSVDD